MATNTKPLRPESTLTALTETLTEAAAQSGRRRRRKFHLRLYPRTLLWQTFALVAILLVAAFSLWIWLFIHYYDEPNRARSTARLVASVVNLAKTALINTHDEQRTSIVFDLATG